MVVALVVSVLSLKEHALMPVKSASTLSSLRLGAAALMPVVTLLASCSATPGTQALPLSGEVFIDHGKETSSEGTMTFLDGQVTSG